MNHSIGAQLNANAGTAMTPTVKEEYVKHLDIVNIASSPQRPQLEQKVEKFKKLIQ